MRRVVQAGTVAGACGLVMVGAGIAHAQPMPTEVTAPQPSLLSAVLGADVSTAAVMASSVLCNNHLIDYNYKSPSDHSPHPCINGPVHSGNSQNSGNFVNHGNPTNSGNLTNTNGSTNSGGMYTYSLAPVKEQSSNGGLSAQGILGSSLQ